MQAPCGLYHPSLLTLGKGFYIVNLLKRRAFIINFIYFAIILALAFAGIKYVLPMVAPFAAGFVIAWFLQRPSRFLSGRLPISRKATALVLVLVFYSVIGLLISLLGIRAVTMAKALMRSLPQLYQLHIEPALMVIFENLERWLYGLDASLVGSVNDIAEQSLLSLGDSVSGLSLSAVSYLSGLASALPGGFIKLLLLIISTFFIAADYDTLTGFCLRQMSGRSREIFLQIKEYVVGTLFVCIRSYALIMSVTFIELSAGLTVIQVENPILIAFLIALFDILPVLGTGGVMIPWVIITALQGDYPLALGLLCVYLAVTVIRNIIEPKIVGSQIGLHPVLTLCSLFVGAQLFGILGLFGFPIGLSLLRYLNENHTIRLYRTGEEEPSHTCQQTAPPVKRQ